MLRSLRWRLQAWHGLILVCVLTGFGFAAYQVARDNQMRRIDRELEQRVFGLFRPEPPQRGPNSPGGAPRNGAPEARPGGPPIGVREGRPDGPPDGPPGGPPHGQPGDQGRDPGKLRIAVRDAIGRAPAFDPIDTDTHYFVAWEADGSVLARSSGAPADVPNPETRDALSPEAVSRPPPGAMRPAFGPAPPFPMRTRSRGELREAIRVIPGGASVLVGRSLSSELAAMRRLAAWLVAAGLGILVLGLAGGWALASQAIRPIDDISATAVRIAAGDLSQRISTADTENELGRLAGVLNATFARLEAAFAQQAQFTSDASHELRTPLAVILAQTQTTLSRVRSAPEYRKALEVCQRAAQQMRGLTEALLELARLDVGEEPMKRERFDLSRVVMDCIELLRPLAAVRRIEIAWELPSASCTGDSERIRQAVTNLLANAIDYNRDGGEIRVSARADAVQVALAIVDTGEGMLPEETARIFERFYRVDRSRSRAHGHTGLGLAICKAIVDAHNGTIEVSSQRGVGSSFTLKLPLE